MSENILLNRVKESFHKNYFEHMFKYKEVTFYGEPLRLGNHIFAPIFRERTNPLGIEDTTTTDELCDYILPNWGYKGIIKTERLFWENREKPDVMLDVLLHAIEHEFYMLDTRLSYIF